MRRLLALALLLAAAACVRDPDPLTFVEPALSVHGVVRAGDTTFAVTLLRRVGDEPIPPGATVRVESGGVMIPLHELPADSALGCFMGQGAPFGAQEPRCYVARLAEPVRPGSRWTLHVLLAPGQTATGTTVVPEVPTIVRPQARQRVALSSFGDGAELRIEWQTADAPRVAPSLGEGVAYSGGRALADVRCHVAARSLSPAVGQPSGSRTTTIDDVYCAGQNGPAVAWDSVIAPVLVTAYDAAYAEFSLRGESVTRGRPGDALQGAYGVFGSAATARREIVILPRS